MTCSWATRTYPHAGEWSVIVRKASDGRIAELVDAFDRADEPHTTGGCLSNLVSAPPLVLVDARGRYLVPRYPRDGCEKPDAHAMAVVNSIDWHRLDVHREKLIRSARSLATGCGDEAKDMLYYEPGTTLSSGQPVLNRHPQLPLHACIYHSSSSLEVGRFVRKVDFNEARSTMLRDALTGSGPTGECAPQPRFALIATPIWDKVGDADVAYLELGGCWRVYFDEWPSRDRHWRSLVGTAQSEALQSLFRLRG